MQVEIILTSHFRRRCAAVVSKTGAGMMAWAKIGQSRSFIEGTSSILAFGPYDILFNCNIILLFFLHTIFPITRLNMEALNIKLVLGYHQSETWIFLFRLAMVTKHVYSVVHPPLSRQRSFWSELRRTKDYLCCLERLLVDLIGYKTFIWSLS